MDISYLNEFVVLAEVKKYSAAAQRLHISQPTLSRHIQAMEAELGSPLFDRTTREMDLSEFGRLYLPYAKRISNEFQKAQAQAEAFTREQIEKVRIGVVHNPDLYHIIDSIVAFQQVHPTIPIQMIEGTANELEAEFAAGRLNIMTTPYAEWETAPPNFIQVGMGRIAAVLSARHPLARQTAIPLSALGQAKLIVPTQATFIYRYLEHRFRQEEIPLNIFYQGNPSGLSKLLEGNQAILIHNAEFARSQLVDSLVLRELQPEISYVYGLLYRERLSKNETTFVAFIRDRFADVSYD